MKVEEFLNITKKYIFELEKTIKEQEIKMKKDAEDIEVLKAIIEELQTKEVIDSFLHNDLSNSMIDDIQDMTILIGNEKIRFHKISNPSEFKRSSTLEKIVDIFKKCIGK
ncbi:hypothetical protein PVAND_016598 [Polypedilum vanderplanki]|uniref:Uncharacterized protein n=1 Tax=Polypedilum vanderplanki TaxID=319348 RepID=A0A9J6BG21_POLVA|nr:hypothetical protein PVAND_016598 [Polypedilum vanderplanki]